jgi:chorismate mutase/prephenate dehydrogenase
MRDSDPLAQLRESIADVDRSLLELLHRRMQLASEVGRHKAAAERPIVVPEVHDRVLTRARQHAAACGVSEAVMESIFEAVVQGSVERQHRVGIEMRAKDGGLMLVLGGAGNMGAWFGRFARLLGHRVHVVDPSMAPLPPTEGRFPSLAAIDDLNRYDAILVSVSLGDMNKALEELLERSPRGLIIEIASIKNPLLDTLEKGRSQGLTISSLHPMFGPGKSPYEPLTFVLACTEDPSIETERIESWLRHPYTQLVPVPFDHHDRMMGWLLGLGHLAGMLFGSALTRSGLSADLLQACASTTYNRQSDTALSILLEDPDLYFDIQHLNPHRSQVYKAMRNALDDLVDSVQDENREDFRQILGQARHFLGQS